MRKVISILAISAFTAGLVVVATPANARDCGNGNWNGNMGYSAYVNSAGQGQYTNHWYRCN